MENVKFKVYFPLLFYLKAFIISANYYLDDYELKAYSPEGNFSC